MPRLLIRIETASLTRSDHETDDESSQIVHRDHELESWTSAPATATGDTENGESESAIRSWGSTYQWNDCFGSLLTAARFEESPYDRGKIQSPQSRPRVHPRRLRKSWGSLTTASSDLCFDIDMCDYREPSPSGTRLKASSRVSLFWKTTSIRVRAM